MKGVMGKDVALLEKIKNNKDALEGASEK